MEITKETYAEVYAILNLMSFDMISKIPEKIWQNIEEKRDKEKNIEIIDIEQYQVSEAANQLLAVLYKNYFSTEEEKNIIYAKEKSLYEKLQEILRQKYNVDNLFKKKKQE